MYMHGSKEQVISCSIYKKRQTCNDIPSHAMVRNLDLKKSSKIPDFLKAACTKSILEHILFSRGMIPCPVDELLAMTNRSDIDTVVGFPKKQETRRETVKKRKYEKHSEQIRLVLSHIGLIFQQRNRGQTPIQDSCTSFFSSGVKAVMLTVGPSFASPREQYLIRFYEWKQCDCDELAISLPSDDVQERLGQEMGRRSVKELVLGSMQDEFFEMFQGTRNACVGTSNTMKVSIACLMEESSAEQLFHDAKAFVDDTSNFHGYCASSSSSTSFSPIFPFIINRNCEVKEPRMYSKSKGLHRPFVVLNVIPNLQPLGCKCCEMSEVPNFEQQESDVWVQLRHAMKGFRVS